MNSRFLLFILVSVILSSCSKNGTDEVPYEATGFIAGYDYALCPCCGGCILEIDNDSTFYRVEDFPSNASINCQDSVSVKFNWTFDRECGQFTYIVIDEIAYN